MVDEDDYVNDETSLDDWDGYDDGCYDDDDRLNSDSELVIALFDSYKDCE